ncbi:MAG: ankyrin repeat domain-containing protein [Tepidisphaeraceae bacterium]
MGKWDNLFAFRAAAMLDNVPGMRAVLNRDATFLADENPNNLPLEFLAKIYQIQTYARDGPIERVKDLVREDPRLIRHPWTIQGWLPLSQAVWGNQAEIVRFLLDNGASGDDRIVEGGCTVLQMASDLDRIEMARTMIEAGADANATAPDGSSPLTKAKSDDMKLVLARG